MRIFQQVNRLVLLGCQWKSVANFIKQNIIVSKFSQSYLKIFKNSKDSKSVLIFSLAVAVVELSAIL